MGNCCCRYKDEKIFSEIEDSEPVQNPNKIDPKLLQNTIGSMVSQSYPEMGKYLQDKAHARQQRVKRKQSLLKSRNESIYEINYRAGSVNPASLLSYEKRCPTKLIAEDPFRYLNFSLMQLKIQKLMPLLEERSLKSADAEVLNLGSNSMSTEEIVKALSLFPGLTGYCLADNQINSLSEISKRLKNTRVKQLALGGNPLESKTVLSFASLLKYLGVKQLGLAGLELGDMRIKHLIEEIQDTNLSGLDLSYNMITNDGFQALCQIGFPGECLNLCGNSITLDSLSTFAQSLSAFPQLKTLDLRGNQIISSSNQLRQVLSHTTQRGVSLFIDSLQESEIRLLSAMHLFIAQGPVLTRKSQIYYPFY